jgi:hypothetical protein
MYKIAIPSYKREKILLQKTLPTLLNSKIKPKYIYIFVANSQEKRSYEETIPRDMYNKIIIGKKGIANQRNFIRNYFNTGEYIVSMDDDIEGVMKFINEKRLSKINNLDGFFKKAYKLINKNNIFIWGIYPVSNPFFMKNGREISTDLKFLIGGLHGYIVRKDRSLNPSPKAEGKEDYEQSILYYLKDGKILRFNRITIKTKFLAPGGLDNITKRFEINRLAAKYLKKQYPQFVTIFHRKNGMTEIKIKDKDHSTTKKNKNVKKNKTRKN